MKKHFLLILLITVLGSALGSGIALAAMQGGLPPISGPFTLADDAEKTIVSHPSEDGTVTVTNNGPDTSIEVKVYDAQGFQIWGCELEVPDSCSAFVPEGGRVDIEDQNDADSNNAQGSWSFSPN